MEEVSDHGIDRKFVDSLRSGRFNNPCAAEFLKRPYPLLPVRPQQVPLGRAGVVFQQLEQRMERLLASHETEAGTLEVYPNADGTRRRPVTQRKENVLLLTVPDQESSHRFLLELVVGLLDRHGPPVEPAFLQHGRGLDDGLEVALAPERAEVCVVFRVRERGSAIR